MENSGVRVGVEKFDGKGSFTMWKIRVEDLLVQTGLDVALEDRPDKISDKEWMSLEKKACATIRACLADDVLYGVIEERTPRGLWSRLHTLYLGRNMCNKLVLKKQLYSLRMVEGGDVAGHIQRFDRMSMDLLNIGVDLGDEDKSLLLLCSLPGSYDSLVMMLLYGKETLIYEEIVSVLRSNEQRERMGKREEFQESLAVSERPRRNRKCAHRGRGQSKESSRVGRCYRCGVAGHYKRECPLRKKCQSGEDSDFSDGTVAGIAGEDGDHLLVCSEDLQEDAVTGRAATGVRGPGHAQQGSAVSSVSEVLSVASGGFQPQVEHRAVVASRMERAVTQVQSAAGAGRQVESRARAGARSDVVSGRASCAASGHSGSLRSLQGSPRLLMRLPGREGSTSQGVQECRHRSSAVEAVTRRASGRAQGLEITDSGSGRTRGCQGTQLQRGARGVHYRACQGCLGAPRWRL